jgi:EpsI family protein
MDYRSKKDKGLKFLIVLTVLIFFGVGFFQVLRKLFLRWSEGDFSYCYLIFPLALYILWERRKDFQFQNFTTSYSGIVAITFSTLIIIFGEFGSVETMMYIGLWCCLVGLFILFYGRRIYFLIFPIIILGFIVPLPPFINRVLTFQLKLVASTLATYMLRLSGITVFQDGNIIDIGVTQLQVVDACSGLRYLIPLLLLALLVGYYFSQSWWRKGLLIFLVLPLSVLLNSLRIWLSGLLTVMGHPELVESFFHDFSGWVIFMIAGAILFGVKLILERINHGHTQTHTELLSERSQFDLSDRRGRPARTKTVNAPIDPNDPKVLNEPDEREVDGWTKPIVLTAIICLMFVSSGYALKQIPSAKNLPPRTSLKSFPMQIGEWQGKRSYIKKEILDQLWSDDYVQATFFHPSKRNAVHVLIPFYEWQGTRHTAHAPQSCLLGGGWTLIGTDDWTVATDRGDGLRVKTLRLAKDSGKILGAYFFFQRGRVITSPWLNKAYLMWDAFSKRRTDGALVRAEMTLAAGQTYEEAYPVLEDFLVKLWPILSEYVPN